MGDQHEQRPNHLAGQRLGARPFVGGIPLGARAPQGAPTPLPRPVPFWHRAANPETAAATHSLELSEPVPPEGAQGASEDWITPRLVTPAAAAPEGNLWPEQHEPDPPAPESLDAFADAFDPWASETAAAQPVAPDESSARPQERFGGYDGLSPTLEPDPNLQAFEASLLADAQEEQSPPTLESLAEIAARLDAELSRFPTPVNEHPSLDAAADDVPPSASEFWEGISAEAASTTPPQSEPHDVGLRNPYDPEFEVAPMIDAHDTAEALREVTEAVAQYSESARVAEILEGVARRVRLGEIAIPAGAPTGSDAAALATVLTSLLGGVS